MLIGETVLVRGLFVIAAVLILTLVAGLSVFGLDGDESAPGVLDAESGCRVHALRFTVTDDPVVFEEQRRFERDVNELPLPSFYEKPVDLVAARHAAAHQYVVVFYGRSLPPDGKLALQALETRATASKAPVIVAPDAGAERGLVALARGYELRCEESGARQAAEISRFAAQSYLSVADPEDPRGLQGVAPSDEHQAISPVDP